MDPGAYGDISFSRSDGKAVFDDVFAFGNRLQGHFMPCRDVLADRKSLAASCDDAAFGNGIDSYGDIIMRVDLEYVHCLLLRQFGNVGFDTDFSHAVQMSRNGIGKAFDS